MKLAKSSKKPKKLNILVVRRVIGQSMEPDLKENQLVIGSSLIKPKIGQMVIFIHDGKEKIKRIQKINNTQMFVTGSNSQFSTDSRSFGWININLIMGVIFWTIKF